MSELGITIEEAETMIHSISNELAKAKKEIDKWKALAGLMLDSCLKAREQKTDFWTTTLGQYIGQELEFALAKARGAGL